MSTLGDAAAASMLGWSFLLPQGVLARSAPRRPPADLPAKLVGALRRPESAAAVGRAYLASNPAVTAAGSAALAEELRVALRAGAAGPDPADTDRPTLRRRLRDQVREDFAASRTVVVRGWVLGETEARLFALAALARDAPG